MTGRPTLPPVRNREQNAVPSVALADRPSDKQCHRNAIHPQAAETTSAQLEARRSQSGAVNHHNESPSRVTKTKEPHPHKTGTPNMLDRCLRLDGSQKPGKFGVLKPQGKGMDKSRKRMADIYDQASHKKRRSILPSSKLPQDRGLPRGANRHRTQVEKKPHLQERANRCEHTRLDTPQHDLTQLPMMVSKKNDSIAISSSSEDEEKGKRLGEKSAVRYSMIGASMLRTRGPNTTN